MLVTLVIGQCPGEAGEPVKLALVSPSQTSSANPTRAVAKAAATDTNRTSLSFTQQVVNTSLPASTVGHSKDDTYLAHTHIALTKKRPAPPAGSLAAFFSGLPGNGNFGMSNFEAGYGQAYNADSIVLRGRNGTAMEEPRYIFFKKIFRF